MSEWIGGTECHKCSYLGEYDDKIDDKRGKNLETY